jgi:hypothetical protein
LGVQPPLLFGKILLNLSEVIWRNKGLKAQDQFQPKQIANNFSSGKIGIKLL